MKRIFIESIHNKCGSKILRYSFLKGRALEVIERLISRATNGDTSAQAILTKAGIMRWWINP